MKLEIKHLAGYLPYGLKAMYGNLPHIQFREVEIFGVVHREYETHPTRLIAEGLESEHIWMFKPILRPLSDLTKEIEHNGERFVPAKVLWNVTENDEELFDLYGTIPEFWEMSMRCDLFTWSYKDVELMHKWHFDIHNLIENNLAIDKNKIKE